MSKKKYQQKVSVTIEGFKSKSAIVKRLQEIDRENSEKYDDYTRVLTEMLPQTNGTLTLYYSFVYVINDDDDTEDGNQA